MPQKSPRSLRYQCDVCSYSVPLALPHVSGFTHCPLCGGPLFLAVQGAGGTWQVLCSPFGRISAETVLRATLERAVRQYQAEHPDEEPPF